jgi:hypothetical protein
MAYIGQVIWCHVAQSRAATWHPIFGQYGLGKKVLESVGFEPATSTSVETLTQSEQPLHRQLVRVMYTNLRVFKFTVVSVGGGDGSGLAPTCGLMVICDHRFGMVRVGGVKKC